MPAKANTLVPLLFSVPIVANQCATVADDRCDIGEGLDVVDEGRLRPRARAVRGTAAGTRLSALAFDGSDQRRLFAADKSAGAQRISTAEAETWCRRYFAQQAEFSACSIAIFRRLTASGYSART